MRAKWGAGSAVRLVVATIAVLAAAAPIATAHSVTAAKHKALKSCGKKGSKHRCGCPTGSKLQHSGGVFRCVKTQHHASPPPTTPPAGNGPTTYPPVGGGQTTANAPAPASVPFPTGAYTCWQTAPSTDPLMPAGTYGSSVVTTVTFNPDGTYHKSNDYVGGAWHESGSSIVFTSGLLWQAGNYDQGVIYPSGTTMPNAAAPVASGYTLVIKDTVQEGGNPPSQEFVNNDGPNGTYSPAESFFYCKM